ncbi:MAG: beta-ketoacyl synthase N-terminal-like domain-containing protein [Bacteroidota bacterium]
MTNIPIYINGLGNVSPQKTTDNNHFLEEPLSFEANRLKIIDLVYKDFIPAEMIRRMSRIIKMGIAASKLCLKDAAGSDDISKRNIVPDAIITGTGLGCLEDTDKFLASMINNKEEFLTPTSFIQSTHNTVAGQIALLLKCHSYNFTYVHRGISFESALLDAITQMRMGEFSNALVGGSDEITNNSFIITNRLGYWKRKPVDTLNLLNDTQRGSIAGEGASFLFLENQRNKHTYARLDGVSAFLKPDSNQEVSDRLNDFLTINGLSAQDIDLVILGLNGDKHNDMFYHNLVSTNFPLTPTAYFKHLCGEYHTASSFAAWLAAMAIKTQTVPEVVRFRGNVSSGPVHAAQKSSEKAVKQFHGLEHVIIYNHFRGNNHSFILLSQL